MKVRFDMRGYTNLFTNTVAIPDHNRLVVKNVFPFHTRLKLASTKLASNKAICLETKK